MTPSADHDRRSVCAALAATAGLALVPGWRAHAAAPDRRTIAADAFIYAFPMLMNYKTLFQQAVDPAFPGYVGGFNRFRHYARGFTPADRDIVTPNNDTPYSWAWFDLRAEPVVISVPASPERYYVVQLVDLYTHNFAYIGSRATGTEAGDYLLAGPGWQGAPPPGVKQVLRSETEFAMTLTRTAWTGPEETEAVRAMQRQYIIAPLSEYAAEQAAGAGPGADVPGVGRERALSLEFVAYLNFLLQFCAPVAAERELLQRFGMIGIGPGLPFDSAALDPVLRADLEEGLPPGSSGSSNRLPLPPRRPACSARARRLGDDYQMRRAVGAAMGIYGNSVEEAVYVGTLADAGPAARWQQALHHAVHQERLPPVRFFWSATMYDLPHRLLVANPIQRYSLGSRSKDLVYEADGSLTIYIQAESPGCGKETNWLPSPTSGRSISSSASMARVPPHRAAIGRCLHCNWLGE